jgi:hypothetical protein
MRKAERQKTKLKYTSQKQKGREKNQEIANA